MVSSIKITSYELKNTLLLKLSHLLLRRDTGKEGEREEGRGERKEEEKRVIYIERQREEEIRTH